MRRVLFLLIICTAGLPVLHAQDPAVDAIARARQLEEEERYKRLDAKLTSVIETQDSILKRQEALDRRLNELASELGQLKAAQSLAGSSYATQTQLKELARQMQDIEDKRVADNKQIVNTLKELQKLPPVVSPPRSEPRVTPAVPDNLEFYSFKVERGQTLSDIIAAYNEEFKGQNLPTISQADVIAINPGLDPNRIFVGSTIRIPKPSKKGR